MQAILAASERLDALSIQLAGEVEPRLSMVFSDTHQPKHHDRLMQLFEQRYPEIELEWMIAEEGDVIDLLQSGRAHLGMVEVQKLSAGYRLSRLPEQTELFVAHQHLRWLRRRRANAGAAVQHPPADPEYLHRRRSGQTGWLVWSAPSYLLLLEMAGTGVRLQCRYALAGATIRPRQTHQPRPRGWPKLIRWMRSVELTPAGPGGVLDAGSPAGRYPA